MNGSPGVPKTKNIDKHLRLTHNSLKYLEHGEIFSVFGVKFSLGEIGRIFLYNLRNFKLWKMPKLFHFRFPEG